MRREAASADTLIVVLYAPLYSIMHLPGSIDRNMVIGTDTTYQFDMIRMIVGISIQGIRVKSIWSSREHLFRVLIYCLTMLTAYKNTHCWDAITRPVLLSGRVQKVMAQHSFRLQKTEESPLRFQPAWWVKITVPQLHNFGLTTLLIFSANCLLSVVILLIS